MTERRNGFTLLELLVALVVFGLLLTTLAQGFHFGLQAWRTEARIADTDGDLSEVDLTLRHLVGTMYPGTQETDQPTLLAGPNAMTFITDLPDAGGSVPARQVEATLSVDARQRLVLRWRPYRHVTQLRPPPPPIKSELLRGVSRIQLAFWQRSGRWVGEWNAIGLPAMVRIHLEFVKGDPRHWADIVVAPRLDPQ